MTTSAAVRPDATARASLVAAHLPLVGHLLAELRAHLPAHLDPENVHAAGLAALTRAAGTFDPAGRTAFRQHAGPRVRQALVEQLRVADAAAPDREQPDEVLARARRGGPGQPTDLTVADLLPATRAGGRQDEGGPALLDAVARLPEHLRAVVVGLHLQGRTAAELAAERGTTEAGVAGLRREALTLLQQSAARTERSGEPVGQQGGRRREQYRAATPGPATPRPIVAGPDDHRDPRPA